MDTEQNTDGTTPGPSSTQGKTKLAVLGGGPSALTALYWITKDSKTREQYDITVYQMGWRLGGKGASGRGEHGRILEHGLHVLFGFYENFFSMIRDCYAEIDRPKGAPLATWDEAFVGQNFGVVEEFFDGSWRPWLLEFPDNDSKPGEGGPWDTEADYVSMIGQALIELLFGWRALHAGHEVETVFNQHEAPPHKKSIFDPIIGLGLRFVEWRLKKHISHAHIDVRHHKVHRSIGWLGKLLWPIMRWLSKRSIASHRFWLGCDFFMALMRGVIDDKVYDEGGFNAIDEYDFREWLTLHGIHELTLSTPFCRTIYDAAFSYQNGDPETQRIAAGAALRAYFRMGFTYKGHAYYKMSAGMGDTVFTPIYEVLKKRGVKFNFFHKVESLHLSAGEGEEQAKSIERIRVLRQAEMANGQPNSSYEPLVNVVDLDCWPAEPQWSQIANADKYVNSPNPQETPQKYVDLESYYEPLPEGIGETFDLVAGQDFDQVLYAIPIGAVPYVCEELCEDNARWRDMSTHVQSVTTVTFQLWFNKDLNELGWKNPEPLLSLYVEPLNTWADMSQVIPREDWPAGAGPKDISYYCGAQVGPTMAPDPRQPENRHFEEEQYAEAKRLSIEFCETALVGLMPDAVNPEQPPSIDWNVLLDPGDGKGVERFDSQYWRSNCGPSERCTLALPGSTKYRMKPGDTGYTNLVVTGDWTDNRLYVACMEGAITSGVYAARAVTGENYPIIGERLNER